MDLRFWKRNKDNSDNPLIINQIGGSVSESVGRSEAMRLSTVYACVKVLSDSIAQLPLEPYTVDAVGRKVRALEHPTYEILNFEPNNRMTRFDFIKILVTSMLLEGNGFAQVLRGSDGVAEGLIYCPSGDITIVTKPRRYGEEIAGYYNARTGVYFHPEDMVHIRNYSVDGIRGISTIEHAGRVLAISTNADKQANKYYSSGGALLGVLKTETGRLNNEQRKEIRQQWLDMINPHNGASNGVAVLEAGLSYQPISIKPGDAQLIETRQFSIPEICRFFNVSPVKVHDLSKSSYSTVEAVNIAFVIDSLSPIIVNIELELRRKLYPPKMRKGMRVEFDTSALIKADTTAQSNLIRSMTQTGVMTPNEGRERLKLPPLDGGDESFMQVNMTRIKDIGNNGQDKQSGQ